MPQTRQSAVDELNNLRIDPAMKSKRSAARRRPWLLLLAAAVLIGGGLFAATLFSNRAVEVSTIRVTPQADAPENSAAAVLTAAGYIVAHHKIQLGSKVMGKVAWIGVEKGDRVKKSQLLVRLEDQEYVARVNEAQAALLSAQAKLNELENGSRPEEISRGRADLALAEANLRNAKVTYERIERLVRDGVETQQNLDDAKAR
jgi:HlyD family secretion protein